MSRLLIAACITGVIVTAIARSIPGWLQSFEDGLVLDTGDLTWDEYWASDGRITS